MSINKQRIVKRKVDPFKKSAKNGAHMALKIFIGDKGQTRRTAEARSRRNFNAKESGWGPERRANFGKGAEGKGASTRGGGAQTFSVYGWWSTSDWSTTKDWKGWPESDWNLR